MKLIQINTQVNSGSTGRIAEDIGRVILASGHESYIAYGRGNHPSKSKLLKIGNKQDIYLHGLKTLLTDRHGFASYNATLNLIKQIEEIQPDAIGLHNLHGYYLHIGVLFEYLKAVQIPILWTLFDCWAFTGHCTYFDDIQCEKWMNHCDNCPKSKKYPKAYFDNSYKNFTDKKRLFTSLGNLQFIVHSNWLKSLVEQSFLKDYPIHVIQSGVDLNQFKPQASKKIRAKYGLNNKKVILGVASIWDRRKGLGDFKKLKELFSEQFQLVLVGLNNKQIKNLPKGIKGIVRTESIQELAELYSVAEVFVNPTWQDNFPTTNIEALACGTPVVMYNTGGSPEAIDTQTGKVVPKGDVAALWQAIQEIVEKGKAHYRLLCRARAEKHFNKDDRYREYLNLYENLINESKNISSTNYYQQK